MVQQAVTCRIGHGNKHIERVYGLNHQITVPFHDQVQALRLSFRCEVEYRNTFAVGGDSSHQIGGCLVFCDFLSGGLGRVVDVTLANFFHGTNQIDIKNNILQGVAAGNFNLRTVTGGIGRAGGGVLVNVEDFVAIQRCGSLCVNGKRAGIVADHGLGLLPSAIGLEQINIAADLGAIDLHIHTAG